jgi:hypothetical protein
MHVTYDKDGQIKSMIVDLPPEPVPRRRQFPRGKDGYRYITVTRTRTRWVRVCRSTHRNVLGEFLFWTEVVTRPERMPKKLGAWCGSTRRSDFGYADTREDAARVIKQRAARLRGQSAAPSQTPVDVVARNGVR